MKTDREARSLISTVGSYALKGRLCALMSPPADGESGGCRTRRRGVEQYPVNCASLWSDPLAMRRAEFDDGPVRGGLCGVR